MAENNLNFFFYFKNDASLFLNSINYSCNMNRSLYKFDNITEKKLHERPINIFTFLFLFHYIGPHILLNLRRMCNKSNSFRGSL